MDLTSKYRFYQKVAICMAIVMLTETFYPTISLALTSGPSSPEFSSFEPASTTSMVNEFSGSFTYNIPVLEVPGANGGGYSCGLSYHSGETVESEASWVGYGWTLNPGAINRHKKGFADDAYEADVTYINDVPANWTISNGPTTGVEAFSTSLSVNAAIRYNNYKGFGYTVGAGFSTMGFISIGYTVSDGEGSFQTHSNAGEILSLAGVKGGKGIKFLKSVGSTYGVHKLGDDIRSTSVTKYNGQSVNISVTGVINPFIVPVGFEVGNTGNFTRQKNEPSTTLPSYGYMYSKDAATNSNSMMDYYIENEDMYNRRDKYLSAPFSNADIYTVSAEGIGGGFRMHNKNSGTFSPNEVSSFTEIAQIAVSPDVGLTMGAGTGLGVGLHELSVSRDFSGSDSGNGNSDNYEFAPAGGDEGTFFRFFNDLGGSVDHCSSTNAVGATIDNREPYVSTVDVNSGLSRSGRSSYIAYHTNSEMGSGSAYSYEKSASTASLVDRSVAPHGIGEIVAFNEEGNRYVYGLPVYSRNEQNMQYDLLNTNQNQIIDKHIAYKNISNPTSRVGEINNTPYANTYLVTEITTPDYLDRTLNGPSDDDFGGYTKFEYDKPYGYNSTSGSWYKWRMPYNGLFYLPNSHTDNLDDMGAMSSGEKEMYYLKKIETKTHIAVFVTNKTDFNLGTKHIIGSQTTRQDALDANHDDNVAASVAAAKGSNEVQLLERIELYAKPTVPGGDYTLIKTTHFEYDYSLCPNMPNSKGNPVMVDKDGDGTPETDINIKKGKLTLKKVWFDYQDVVNARISPYTFDYKYPAPNSITTANGIPSNYSNLLTYGNGYTASMQNPDYDPLNLDRWGSPQAEGKDRHNVLNPWVDQTPAEFNPAAWQLKKITLPSGGEILVQYEQQDYLYVQDRRAMAMVSLKSYIGDGLFILNVDNDLGITTRAKKIALRDIIRRELIDKDQKIYFKFLYALTGNSPQLSNCTSDYVDGYVNVQDVDVNNNDELFISVGSGSSSYKFPKDVCLDYVKREKGGKLGSKHSCDAEEGIPEGEDPVSLLYQLLNFANISLTPNDACAALKESLSYLRIPVLNAKKGGGIRVKRVMMHDPGIESGDEALYGTEYFYTDVDGNSSGVAVNEPSMGREENALVTFLPKRSDQGKWEKITAGKDKKQFEGPLGEHLLPGASVGYSRVVAKSIHTGSKTNTGYVVNEFYTAKDYPFDKYYNIAAINGKGVDNTGIDQDEEWQYLPIPFFPLLKNNLWLSQGYRFIINEMHGQQKSIATYAGNYLTSGATPNPSPSSKQEFTYFEPGEQVPMMTDVNTITMGNPGVETEVVMERKAISDIGANANVEVDLQMSIVYPLYILYPSGFPSVSYTENKLQTHVTSKIIKYPAILKKVTSMQDNIYHVTQNLGFSPTTGEPLLTKTTDGYNKLNLEQSSNHDGSYLAYEIPASSAYKEMGQKASNERKIIASTSALTLSITNSGSNYYLAFAASPGNSVCGAMNTFSRGDLIKIGTSYFHTDEISGSTIKILPAGLLNTSAINIGNGSVSSVEIVHSGKTNQLSSSVGSFTTYGAKQNPVVNAIPTGTLQPRINFATALNNAINSNSPTIVYSGSAKMTNAAGECNTITPSKIKLAYASGEISLSVETVPEHFGDCVEDSHPAVADLNNFLDKSWSLNIAELPCFANETGLFNGLCGNGKFCTQSLAALAARTQCSQAVIIDQIKVETTQKHLLETQYTFCGGTSGLIGSFNNIGLANGYYAIDVEHQDIMHDYTSILVGNKEFSFDYVDLDACRCVFGPSYANVTGVVSNSSSSNYCNYPIPPFVANTCNDIQKESLFNFWRGTTTYTESQGKFHMDKTGWLYYEFLSQDPCGRNGTKIINIKCLMDRPIVPAEYCTKILKSGGQFSVDPNTGELQYKTPDNDCYPQSLGDCFKFCPAVNSSQTVNNVIASNAATYDCIWPYDPSLFTASATGANVYETGEKGKWRMNASYVYNSTIKSGSRHGSATERNYNDAGIYPMVMFDWKNAGANDPANWIKASTVNKYSANGEAIEKSDALNVKSAAKYGYKGMLPYLVAKNSDYASSQFESFENVYTGNKLEEGAIIVSNQVDNTVAHSGKSSLKLSVSSPAAGIPGIGSFVLQPIPVTPQITANGLNFKVWVKKDPFATGIPIALKMTSLGSTTSVNIPLDKIAQTGEWTLYEAKSIKPGAANITTSVVFTIVTATADKPVWIDDVRVQPYDALVMTYVYDNATMRLLASFDDQHFGLFYQYSAEGKLVRKLIETERGIKTVQESQYHTPWQNR